MIAFLCRRNCEAIMKCYIYLCGVNRDCVKKKKIEQREKNNTKNKYTYTEEYQNKYLVGKNEWKNKQKEEVSRLTWRHPRAQKCAFQTSPQERNLTTHHHVIGFRDIYFKLKPSTLVVTLIWRKDDRKKIFHHLQEYMILGKRLHSFIQCWWSGLKNKTTIEVFEFRKTSVRMALKTRTLANTWQELCHITLSTIITVSVLCDILWHQWYGDTAMTQVQICLTARAMYQLVSAVQYCKFCYRFDTKYMHNKCSWYQHRQYLNYR